MHLKSRHWWCEWCFTPALTQVCCGWWSSPIHPYSHPSPVHLMRSPRPPPPAHGPHTCHLLWESVGLNTLSWDPSKVLRAIGACSWCLFMSPGSWMGFSQCCLLPLLYVQPWGSSLLARRDRNLQIPERQSVISAQTEKGALWNAVSVRGWDTVGHAMWGVCIVQAINLTHLIYLVL